MVLLRYFYIVLLHYVSHYTTCRNVSMLSVMGCGCPVDTSAKQKHRPRRQPRPPSRIRIVRRISFGITTLPKSSILLTIPVAFIYKSPLIQIVMLVFVIKGKLYCHKIKIIKILNNKILHFCKCNINKLLNFKNYLALYNSI